MAARERIVAPERLRAQVLADWAPVTPLRSPWRRAAWLAPLAAAMTGIAATYWGPQPDWAAPGFALTAALSAVQWVAGLGLLALALREAVPGRAVRPATASAVIVALVTLLAVNLAADEIVAAALVPAGWAWRFWLICLRGPLLLAAPVLVLGCVLAARASPTRPVWAGALAGLAAGVLSDAGWRLGCFVTDASHVVGAHWLAIAASSGVGALIVRLADVMRWAVMTAVRVL